MSPKTVRSLSQFNKAAKLNTEPGISRTGTCEKITHQIDPSQAYKNGERTHKSHRNNIILFGLTCQISKVGKSSPNKIIR
jgi:hypothetical protein